MIRGSGTLNHDSPAGTDVKHVDFDCHCKMISIVVAGMAYVKKSAPWATAKGVCVLEPPTLVSGYQIADSSAA